MTAVSVKLKWLVGEKTFTVRNKQGLGINGLLNLPVSAGGKLLTPIILLHGFKGFMRMPMLELLAESLVKLGYAVYRFDATNSLGESGGDIYNSTVTQYLADTGTVLGYLMEQKNLDLEKLAVFGTSMGGLIAVLLAETDNRVKRLVTHSAALDWNILRQHPDLTGWQEGEWLEFMSKSQGRKIKVSFNLLTDGIKYDPYPGLARLNIPKLFLHSGTDEAIPLSFSERAYKEAASPKKLVIIPGASHNVTDPSLVNQMAAAIHTFLKSCH